MSTKVIKFGADFCNPCKTLDPILKEIQTEHPEIEFEFVDVDENPSKAAEYNVMGIPRVFILKDDKITESFAGVKPKEAIVELLLK